MAFKTKQMSTDKEKLILTGLISNHDYIKQIKAFINIELLKSPTLKMLSNWALEYYTQFDKPITIDTLWDVLESNKEFVEEEVYKQLQYTTEHIEEHYLPRLFNVEYNVKQTEKYLALRSFEKLKSNLETAIINEDPEEAEHSLSTFKKVEKPIARGIDLLHDIEFITSMFEDQVNLIDIPGELGKYLGDIYRGDLVGIGGVMKSGKTWTLGEFGKWALFSQCNVAYFTVEMKDFIMAKRLFQGFSAKPKKEYRNNLPVAFYDEKQKTIRTKFYSARKALEDSDVRKMQKKLLKRSYGATFKMYDLSDSGGNVEAINTILDNEEYHTGFVPDVVIVDYADILRPERNAPKVYRDQLNQTWLSLKWMAQQRNCVVVTASQLGRAGLSRDAGVADISDDIRKFAHASLWISLNKTKEEHVAGIIRIHADGRYENHASNDELICTRCLEVGRPFLQSVWKSDILNYDEYINGFSKDGDEK